MHVEVNEQWTGYLQENYTILTSFAYWNLTNFLQVRNPNVPNIPGKLIKPEERNNLSNQREFWNTAINNGLEVHCLYTGKNTHPTSLRPGSLHTMELRLARPNMEPYAC